MAATIFDDPRPFLRVDDIECQGVLDRALAKGPIDWLTSSPSKPQSYFDHVVDVYLVWAQLITLHRGLIDRIAARASVDSERLLQSSLLCVALHDVGKLTGNFQDMLSATSKSEYRLAQQRNYRHEIAVLPLVMTSAKELDTGIEKMIGGGHLEVLAVAGHHRFLAEGYLFCEDGFRNEIDWNPKSLVAIKPAYLLAQKMFRQQGWRLPNLKSFKFSSLTNAHANYPFKQLVHSRDDVAELAGGLRYREVFVLLRSLLMIADWRASGAIKEIDRGTERSQSLLNASLGTVRIPKSSILPFVKRKIEATDREFKSLRTFQTDCGNVSEHVLAIAPTGSGKTEAAFLWALNQIETGQVTKILFLLPTMVTANSLHQRAVDFFFKEHQHQVGLIHSTADLVQQKPKAGDDSDDSDSPELQRDILAERHFFSPVTVGTIDQLLNSLFHAGHWAMKTFAAMDAAIIIDEVHAYDPHTTGLISKMLEQLSAAGTKFMVMSATMPNDLRTVISISIAPNSGTLTTICDRELQDSARNDWEFRDHRLTEWLLDDLTSPPSISRAAKRWLDQECATSHRVLIVVNTVRRCQDIAIAIRDHYPDAVCYHSKFIFKHRSEIEARVTEENSRVQILIATQVVEVSLDIDFDVMLSECAPMDALVQRAGRVNRKRRPALGRVIVFAPESGSEKLYNEPFGILARSKEIVAANQGAPTETDLLRMVEATYTGTDLANHLDFQRVKDSVNHIQQGVSGVFDKPRPHEDSDDPLVTRLIKYQQMSVVPSQFEDHLKTIDRLERRRYELKMPVWYVNQHGHFNQEVKMQICEMIYDDFLGGQMLLAQLPGGTVSVDPSLYIF